MSFSLLVPINMEESKSNLHNDEKTTHNMNKTNTPSSVTGVESGSSGTSPGAASSFSAQAAENLSESASVAAPPNTNPKHLYVTGLPFQWMLEDVHSFFSQFGVVDMVKLLYDAHQHPKGTGFVHFREAASAATAIQFLNNQPQPIGEGAHPHTRIMHAKYAIERQSDHHHHPRGQKSGDSNSNSASPATAASTPDNASHTPPHARQPGQSHPLSQTQSYPASTSAPFAFQGGGPHTELPPGIEPSLYVAGLPRVRGAMARQIVEELFAPYGPSVQVKILTEPQTDVARGIAFVRFDNKETAIRAMEGIHGMTIEGCQFPLQVKWAREKKSDVMARAAATAAVYGAAGMPFGALYNSPFAPPPPQAYPSAADMFQPPQPYPLNPLLIPPQQLMHHPYMDGSLSFNPAAQLQPRAGFLPIAFANPSNASNTANNSANAANPNAGAATGAATASQSMPFPPFFDPAAAAAIQGNPYFYAPMGAPPMPMYNMAAMYNPYAAAALAAANMQSMPNQPPQQQQQQMNAAGQPGALAVAAPAAAQAASAPAANAASAQPSAHA